MFNFIHVNITASLYRFSWHHHEADMQIGSRGGGMAQSEITCDDVTRFTQDHMRWCHQIHTVELNKVNSPKWWLNWRFYFVTLLWFSTVQTNICSPKETKGPPAWPYWPGRKRRHQPHHWNSSWEQIQHEIWGLLDNFFISCFNSSRCEALNDLQAHASSD